MGKRTRGHTARIVEQNTLKKYSTPYDVTLSNQTRVAVVPKQLLLGDWMVIGLLVNDCLCFFSPYLLNELHLYQCFCPFTALSHPAAGTEQATE